MVRKALRIGKHWKRAKLTFMTLGTPVFGRHPRSHANVLEPLWAKAMKRRAREGERQW